jgi:[ribosomal protein S5]-alanine N-acetyltransferase
MSEIVARVILRDRSCCWLEFHEYSDAPDPATHAAAAGPIRCACYPASFHQLEHHQESRIRCALAVSCDGAESFVRLHLEKIAAGEEIYQWVLAMRSGDGEAIGNIHFRPRADNPKGNRGFWLAEPYWNQGLMTEAISSVNDFAFHTLDIESFYVCNVASNAASRRVKQKTGAEFVGYIELLHHNGQSRSGKWRVPRENWLRQTPPSLG